MCFRLLSFITPSLNMSALCGHGKLAHKPQKWHRGGYLASLSDLGER